MEAAKDQEEINGTLTKCILKLMESPITTLTCVQNENRFLWMSEAPLRNKTTFFAKGIWISFQWKLYDSLTSGLMWF